MNIKSFFRGLWSLKDLRFQNVPASTAYTMFLFGLIHFVVLASAYIDLNKIQEYNWGIFKDLGLADSWQVPIMTVVMFFDAFLMFYGWYLIRHIEPPEEKRKHDFSEKDSLK